LVTTFNSGFGHGFSYAYFVGIFAAPALMGYALRRSRRVPRWLAVLFFAGLEVAKQSISAGPVVILYMLPFAAMVLLAARIWQAAALPGGPTGTIFLPGGVEPGQRTGPGAWAGPRHARSSGAPAADLVRDLWEQAQTAVSQAASHLTRP
jgi:hypothetical protein